MILGVQPICPACFLVRAPVGSVPVPSELPAAPVACYFCGALTADGIYIRLEVTS
jgi:hypothetical protein